MKKLTALMTAVILCLTLAGCGNDDGNGRWLDGIFRETWGVTTADCNVSPLYPEKNGYRMVRAYSDTSDGGNRIGLTLFTLDKDGIVTDEVPLSTDLEYPGGFSEKSGITLWENRILLYSGGLLTLFDWEGQTIAQTEIREIFGTSPQGAYDHNILSYTCVTEQGIVIPCGKKLYLLDDTLTLTESVKLPGRIQAQYTDDGTCYAVYTDDEDDREYLGVFDGSGITEKYPLPDDVQGTYQDRSTAGFADGLLYWYDPVTVYCAQPGENEGKPVMSIPNSGVENSWIRSLRITGELVTARYHSKAGQLGTDVTPERYAVLAPAEKIDLDGENVIEAAVYGYSDELYAMAMEFNRSQSEYFMVIHDYSQYRSADDRFGWRTRLNSDLRLGLIEPDLVYLYDDDIFALEKSNPGYFTDLYTLMTGQMKPEDVFGAVKNTIGKDGALYGIAPNFTLYSLVGKRANLDSAAPYSMADLFDYAANLPEDVILIDNLGQDNYGSVLFGGNQTSPFFHGGQAYFDTEEYIRYLEFLKTLPKKGETLVPEIRDNKSDIAAGVVNPDELPAYTEENWYAGDKAILQNLPIYHPGSLFSAMKTYASDELTCIGYPGAQSGVIEVGMPLLYAVPANSQHKEVVWGLIENLLIAEAEGNQFFHDDVYTTAKQFCTYKPEYLAYLDRLTGTNAGLGGGGYTFDEEMKAQVIELLENSGSPAWDRVPSAVLEIAAEEESKYLSGGQSAEECAKIVRSRSELWLAENE